MDGGYVDAGDNCIRACCLVCGFDATGCTSCPADLNRDFVVDSIDLGILIEAWGPCEGCIADINGDGVVNGQDLNIQLGEWGDCS